MSKTSQTAGRKKNLVENNTKIRGRKNANIKYWEHTSERKREKKREREREREIERVKETENEKK